jgi:hypothetical protein
MECVFRVQRRNRADRNPAWPGIGSTDSSADMLPLSGSQRIDIRWKAQSLRFLRPKAQEAASSFWTSAHRRALVFVRLLSQPHVLRREAEAMILPDLPALLDGRGKIRGRG